MILEGRRSSEAGLAHGGGTGDRHAVLFLTASLAYGLLVVYASLVPFALQPLDWAEAWRRFQHIEFLVLGPESRADWIANLVAYLPLGFLLAASPGGRAPAGLRGLAAIAAVALCLVLAVGVEFAQVFFAPRTVSLNDLAAEAIGAVLGAVAGLLAAPRSAAALAVVSRGGRPALRVVVGLYVLGYLALTLFPYDFVIDRDELHSRLALSAAQLWVLPGADRSIFHVMAALGAAAVAMMPVGVFLARGGRGPLGGIVRAVVAGLLIGLVIEGLQALLLSGVSELVSVLARAVGAGLGAVALIVLRRADLPRLRRRLRVLAPFAVPPYLVFLVVVNDLASGGWLELDAAGAKLAGISFIPFYYHYFTTEAVAMISAVSHVAMYAPVGALLWLWRRAESTGAAPVAAGAPAAAVLAALLATVFEGARLFKGDLRADPTNVLIAAAAAGFAHLLLTLGWAWIGRAPAVARFGAAPPPSGAAERRATSAGDSGHRWQHGLALLPAAAAVAGIALYPLLPAWLGLGLAIYAAVLWRWPQAWLVLLPAALPALDLAPWSGRFFFTEGDLVVLTTLAVLLVRQAPLRAEAGTGRLAAALILLLALAQFAALLRGLLPLPGIGLNSFDNYFSAYNALRVGKGFLWAVLLLPALSLALARDGAVALRRLGLGVALGLGAVVLVALHERLIFAGLFNFELPFRITATFSSMHLGGGSLGAFLALAMPFLALPFLTPARPLLRIGAAVLLLAAAYVVVVSFNRAAYLGVAAGFLLLLVVLPALPGRRIGRRVGAAGALAAAAAVGGGLIFTLPGSFAAERFERFGEDLEVRIWEWREGLALAEPGPLAALFGTGLGSYPRSFLLRDTSGSVPTTFAIAAEDGGRFLRLGAGESLYFGQRVAVRPGTLYRLGVRLRASDRAAKLVVPICAKSLLYSFRCAGASFAPQTPGTWEQHMFELRLDGIGRPAGPLGWLTGRPVELALYNPVAGTTIDIDDVSLVALDGPAAGTELLVNGGFDAGTDRWFFAADNLAIWRIENMWLMILFEQGWFGVAALAAALAVAFLKLARRIAGAAPGVAGGAAVLFAGLAGFLVVGLAYGLVDAPRLMTLFYLLLFAALCLGRPAVRPAARRAVDPCSLRPGMPGAVPAPAVPAPPARRWSANAP